MADVLETVAPGAPVTAKRPVPTDLDKHLKNPGRKNPGSRPASSCATTVYRQISGYTEPDFAIEV